MCKMNIISQLEEMFNLLMNIQQIYLDFWIILPETNKKRINIKFMSYLAPHLYL